jgi:putative intracellular protease/amidase
LLIVVDNFNFVEYGVPAGTFRDAGYEVVIASDTLEPIQAYDRDFELEAELLFSDVHAADYDAIVFVGGYASGHGLDPDVQRIVHEAYAQGKVLAGICAGVDALGHTGVLSGHEIVDFSIFCGSDVTCVGENVGVHRDAQIVTAVGPGDAREFALTILEALQEE